MSSTNNRTYVSDIHIKPTGLQLKAHNTFNKDYDIHYDTHSKNCYIACEWLVGTMFRTGLTPFISPNGLPYKFDEKLKKLYY